MVSVNNISNSRTTLIIGWMFLIASFFASHGVNLICASIFFAAHFVIKTINKEE